MSSRKLSDLTQVLGSAQNAQADMKLKRTTTEGNERPQRVQRKTEQREGKKGGGAQIRYRGMYRREASGGICRAGLGASLFCSLDVGISDRLSL